MPKFKAATDRHKTRPAILVRMDLDLQDACKNCAELECLALETWARQKLAIAAKMAHKAPLLDGNQVRKLGVSKKARALKRAKELIRIRSGKRPKKSPMKRKPAAAPAPAPVAVPG